MRWSVPVAPGFVAVYEFEERKFLLPVAAAIGRDDDQFASLWVVAPSKSPQAGRLVPASTAMEWTETEKWKFVAVGYASDHELVTANNQESESPNAKAV